MPCMMQARTAVYPACLHTSLRFSTHRALMVRMWSKISCLVLEKSRCSMPNTWRSRSSALTTQSSSQIRLVIWYEAPGGGSADTLYKFNHTTKTPALEQKIYLYCIIQKLHYKLHFILPVSNEVMRDYSSAQLLVREPYAVLQSFAKVLEPSQQELGYTVRFCSSMKQMTQLHPRACTCKSHELWSHDSLLVSLT